MCGSSDSFPAPLRLRGRKGENLGPPDMNFPEVPEFRHSTLALLPYSFVPGSMLSLSGDSKFAGGAPVTA
jgi:hypothetical protein